MATDYQKLLERVRSCRLCEEQLEFGPRPVVQLAPEARILIAGQAPGSKVHASGVPFDDASGDRLREWMGIDKETFYDPTKIAILPMGFCYPGKGRSGDLPPVPLCAETWRDELMALIPNIKLSLAIGSYAQKWHLPSMEKNLTETVRKTDAKHDQTIALPHPSPRNNIWLKKNEWFEKEIIPVLRKRVSKTLKN